MVIRRRLMLAPLLIVALLLNTVVLAQEGTPPVEPPTNTPTLEPPPPPTETPLPTATETPIPTNTETPVPTQTPTNTETASQTPTLTLSATETATETAIVTETATGTPTEFPLLMLLEEETATPTPPTCSPGWYVRFDGCDTLAYQIELGQVVPYFVDINSPPNALRTAPDNFHPNPDAVRHMLRITVFIPESAVMHGYSVLIRNEDAQAQNGWFRVRDRTTGVYTPLTFYWAGGSWIAYFSSSGVDLNLTNVSEFQIEIYVDHALPHNPVAYLDSIGLNLSNVTVTPTFTPTQTDTPTPTATTTSTPTDTPTSTPTPIDRASLPVGFDPDYFPERTLNDCTANYTGQQRNHCWVHVSVLKLIETLNENGIAFTHQALLEALIEGEYRSSIAYAAGIVTWGNEAVARQFYGACGNDGCQGMELYYFLDYFQSPLAETLDDDYRQVLSITARAQQPGFPGFQVYVQQLEVAVSAVLTPADAAWMNGPASGRPYGYGTRGLPPTTVNVSDAQVTLYAQLCGFAARTVSNGENPPFGQMFIGTTQETDPALGGTCSFTN